MIKTALTDIRNGNSPFVDENSEYGNGLIVATRQLQEFDFRTQFFINPTYGIDMNQNATFGGSPVLIYDENVGAGGGGEWNTSAISGTWTFNSATQHYNGSVSIDGSATATNNVMQLAPGAGSFDFTGYTAITGYIYTTLWGVGVKQINIYGWNTTTSTIVGNSVNIANYINTGILNSWQKFTIPLSDMNLTNQTINSLRVQVIGTPVPDFFLDYIHIQETGGPIEYILTPQVDSERLYVCGINFTFAGPYSAITTVAGATENATFPNLSYDKLLNLNSLTNGIRFVRVQENQTKTNVIVHTLFDFMSLANTKIDSFFGDGTNAFLKLMLSYSTPVKLGNINVDYLALYINDDLSSLLNFRVSACCQVEIL